MSTEDNASEITAYTKEVEDLFINFMVSKPDLFVRCKGILKPQYFDNKQNRDAIAFIEAYSIDFSSIPSLQQIKAVTNKDIDMMEIEAAKHDDWFLREFELFCRYRALRESILASPEKLEEGRYGEVLADVKAAVEIALVKDLGTDYYANPKERLEAIKDGKGQVSSGWKGVDEKLYGGLNRGEITILAGQSGSGKSIFLQNFAVNWAHAGLNVVYITLELSEKLSAMRIDAMHTGYETRDVMRNIEDVHMRIRASQMKSKGTLRIKQLPNGCTSNDIRAFIKEYEIQTGVKVDALLVDYLDLMMPMSKKISAENLFVKDKYVAEELRNLAIELDTLTVSASQLNRCLSPDTIVEIDGVGKIKISDVKVGDKIMSSTGYNTVLDAWGGRQHAYKIRTKSGKEIVCSAHHRFPVPNGINTIENGMKVGDVLIVNTTGI